MKRRLAGQALVEHAAERVDVGARVERLGGDLLGGGVVHRAGEVGGGRSPPSSGGAGEAEVGQVAVLRAALLGDEHIRRLDVSVHEPVLVGRVEGLSDLTDELERAARARAAPPARAAYQRSSP